MMFLQFAIAGAWVPLFAPWLRELELEPLEMAWAFATSALASLVAPVLAGQVADRWLAAERCIAICSFLTGCVLWLQAEMTQPLTIISLSLAMWFFLLPLWNLGAALSFRHLQDPEREFGLVRMWGTIGWIAAGLVMGAWFYDLLGVRRLLGTLWRGTADGEWADGLRLGAIMAWALTAYSFTLPHSPPIKSATDSGQRRLSLWAALDAPLTALRLFRKRAFAVYCLCALGLCITIPFSTQMTSLLLLDKGVPSHWLPPAMTVAQSLEVVTLALLPMILLRLESRGTLLLGLLAWTTSMAVQAWVTPAWLVIPALGLNGVCVCCYLVAGQLFVNRQAGPDIRASAQGLFSFSNGVGLLMGHLLVGFVRKQAADDFPVIFGIAAGLAALFTLIFMLGFREPRSVRSQPE